MASPQPKFVTVQQYREAEELATEKHEYHNGRIYAMSGGSLNHSLITLNIAREIGNRLMGTKCRTYSSDLRIYIEASGLSTYPDLSVVCGKAISSSGSENEITNPTVLVEVLSPSTMKYDLTSKFEFYKGIESLQDVIFIWQDRPQVELRCRQLDGDWISTMTIDLTGNVEIPSLALSISMNEIYYEVEFISDTESLDVRESRTEYNSQHPFSPVHSAV